MDNKPNGHSTLQKPPNSLFVGRYPHPVSRTPDVVANRIVPRGQLRDQLRTARRELTEVVPARDYFASERAVVAPFAVAGTILETACSRAEAEELRSDPPAFVGKLRSDSIELDLC